MEKSVFIEKIKSFIKKEHLFDPQSTYLAAVSGGADSVVMLRAMLEIGIKCEAAHCNFHLRGDESDRDEKFVTDMCLRLGVKLHKVDFNVAEYEHNNHVSTEMACRDLRYDWFASIVRSRNLGGVIVAHHCDDNIETLFLNILRGSGVAGLAGMQPSSQNRITVLRPLLCVSRADIEAFAAEVGQHYIIDSTNRENIVKRNRLRNVILPMLCEQFPDAVSGILHTISNMRDCNKLYTHNIETLRKKYIDASASPLMRIKLHEFLDSYIADGCAATLVFELLKPFGFNAAQAANIVEAYSAGNSASSGQTFCSSRFEAALSRGSLCLSPTRDSQEEAHEYDISLSGSITAPAAISVEHVTGTSFSAKSIDGKYTVCFSPDILQTELKLRHWHEGDRFCPFGMKGSRLVSDLFSDMKLSTIEKRLVWILTANGKIVWILGLRAASLYKVSPSSTDFIRLTFAKQPQRAVQSNHYKISEAKPQSHF